jgi:hypothetical protein
LAASTGAGLAGFAGSRIGALFMWNFEPLFIAKRFFALGSGVFPALNQEGEMIMHRETIGPVSLTVSTDYFVCHCEGTGWILIKGKGVKECSCRILAKTIRKLKRIPPESERLRGFCPVISQDIGGSTSNSQRTKEMLGYL